MCENITVTTKQEKKNPRVFQAFFQSHKLYFSIGYRNKKVNVIITFICQVSVHINSSNITDHQRKIHQILFTLSPRPCCVMQIFD